MSSPYGQSLNGTPCGQYYMDTAFGQPMGTPCNQPPMSSPGGQSLNGTPYGQHSMDTLSRPATHEQSLWAVPLVSPWALHMVKPAPLATSPWNLVCKALTTSHP
ncbi:unnamed protein product [Effrenium voratum]|uniref:Uncharacterized protein n=1 Tax=Effrenium voratum TaxID=2562239 RepID=A0AA36HQ45_9DINO|nr:unnamed protein product [Effrenium voratum]